MIAAKKKTHPIIYRFHQLDNAQPPETYQDDLLESYFEEQLLFPSDEEDVSMAKPQSPETVLGIEQDPDTVGKLFVLFVCVLYTIFKNREIRKNGNPKKHVLLTL